MSVEVLEFPPLPPSPVEEADEENLDLGDNASTISISKFTGHTSHPVEYRPRVPAHRETSVDLKDYHPSVNTQSMDAGYLYGGRTVHMSRGNVSLKDTFFLINSLECDQYDKAKLSS